MKDIITTKQLQDFLELYKIIESGHLNAHRVLNISLITTYWNVGSYVSSKINQSKWGKSIVKQFSSYLMKKNPHIKDYSSSNIWRMKQLYETYKDFPNLAPLVREINWTNNIIIMSRTKSYEEKEFYLKLCHEHAYSKQELERQIETRLFHRQEISNINFGKILEKNKAISALRDNYVLEFMDLPNHHEEKDLHIGILNNMKDVILEFGKDFAFIGSEYRVQVGNTDFYIDLLFYHRELSCLVAIELKIGKFMPADLGQLEFYLEALDRDVKKKHENPSVGLILCAEKDYKC